MYCKSVEMAANVAEDVGKAAPAAAVELELQQQLKNCCRSVEGVIGRMVKAADMKMKWH